ncbi:MAG: hypothetical protein R3C27_03045 [Hyphomonadaceae bacterium]
MLGMLKCGECSQALSAVGVMPGMLAMTSKGGASRLGEFVCPESTAWQAAHAFRAYANPRAGDAPVVISDGDVWTGAPAQALTRKVRPASIACRIDRDIAQPPLGSDKAEHELHVLPSSNGTRL